MVRQPDEQRGNLKAQNRVLTSTQGSYTSSSSESHAQPPSDVSQIKGVKTSKQLADLQEKCSALLTRIQNWRKVQIIYTPHTVSLISQALHPETNAPAVSVSPPPESLPKDIPLFLPSSLPSHIHALPEVREICQLERRLCEPQADDALAEIQHQRSIIQGLWLFKRMNMSGTGNKPNTLMITLYKCFDNKTS